VQGVNKAPIHQPKPSIASKVSFSNKQPEPAVNMEAGSSALTASKVVQQHVSTLVTYAEGKHNIGNASVADKDSDLNTLANVAITKKNVTFSSASYEQNRDVENYVDLHYSFDMLPYDIKGI
jgi:hypothetical protein